MTTYPAGRTTYTKLVRAFAERRHGRHLRPVVKVVYADGGTAGSLQLTPEQAATLAVDLDEAIKEARQWERERADRRKRRQAKKDGITLPLPTDRPMIPEDDPLQLHESAMPEPASVGG